MRNFKFFSRPLTCVFLLQNAFADFKVTASELCANAKRAPVYSNLIMPSESLKAQIQKYKSDWKSLCAKTGKITLANLYTQALEIEDAFAPLRTQVQQSQTIDANEAHTVLSVQYPTFIPGFSGSVMEFDYFKPEDSLFKLAKDYGSEEDKIFFSSELNQRQELMSPWIAPTWDYGGCTMFGEYDWTKTIKELDALDSKLKSPHYVNKMAKMKQSLVDEFKFGDRRPSICICKDKEGLKKDLLTLKKFLAANSRWDELKNLVVDDLTALQKNKIDLKSEAEAHCSGG
jgi:hypothetical protein